MPAPAAPHTPDEAVIHRTPDGALEFTLDGRAFPYALHPADPVIPTMVAGDNPVLIVRIPVRQVRYRDEWGAHQLVDPAHHHEDPEPPTESEMAEREALPDLVDDEPQAPGGVEDDQGAHGIVEDGHGRAWFRCAQECTLKALGPGLTICDENTPACPDAAP